VELSKRRADEIGVHWSTKRQETRLLYGSNWSVRKGETKSVIPAHQELLEAELIESNEGKTRHLRIKTVLRAGEVKKKADRGKWNKKCRPNTGLEKNGRGRLDQSAHVSHRGTPARKNRIYRSRVQKKTSNEHKKWGKYRDKIKIGDCLTKGPGEEIQRNRNQSTWGIFRESNEQKGVRTMSDWNRTCGSHSVCVLEDTSA